MGAPNVLEKHADKIPDMVAKSSVAAVAAKLGVTPNSIYYRLSHSKKKAKKNGKKK